MLVGKVLVEKKKVIFFQFFVWSGENLDHNDDATTPSTTTLGISIKCRYVECPISYCNAQRRDYRPWVLRHFVNLPFSSNGHT